MFYAKKCFKTYLGVQELKVWQTCKISRAMSGSQISISVYQECLLIHKFYFADTHRYKKEFLPIHTGTQKRAFCRYT